MIRSDQLERQIERVIQEHLAACHAAVAALVPVLPALVGRYRLLRRQGPLRYLEISRVSLGNLTELVAAA